MYYVHPMIELKELWLSIEEWHEGIELWREEKFKANELIDWKLFYEHTFGWDSHYKQMKEHCDLTIYGYEI